MTNQTSYDDAAAFGYIPGEAPALGREPPLGDAEIAHARELLLLPGSTIAGAGRALGISAQTIRRYVPGEPRSR
ncbi:hypothetical protein GTY54_08035 [Streptomyces sp. SID625]|nr:hypothetical protein [Streptomyces sp. SID625]